MSGVFFYTHKEMYTVFIVFILLFITKMLQNKYQHIFHTLYFHQSTYLISLTK